jgi:hypothetical protein
LKCTDTPDPGLYSAEESNDTILIFCPIEIEKKNKNNIDKILLILLKTYDKVKNYFK